jgi:spermidine/putrescine transport system substrate-binding protein
VTTAAKEDDMTRHLTPAQEKALWSRRELLRRGSLAAASLGFAPTILAACGGSDSGSSGAATTSGGGTPTVPEAKGSIDFLSWEGYDLPKPMKAWKHEHGVKVNPTYIGNHNDIQAKLKAGGGGGYDLITYYQGYKPLYKELDIIQPLDENKIPNLKNLFPFFASDVNNFWLDADGTRTGVPWTWGSEGLTYDTAAIDEPTTYDLLFEPDMKGKVSIVDDAVGAFTQTSHILGFDPSTMTEDQFQQAQDYLKRIIAQTNGVAPSYGDMTSRLVAGDVVVCYEGWAAMDQFARDAGKDTVKTVIPTEGGFSFCDSYAIPPTADNADTAYAWINEVLSPKVAAEAAAGLVAGVTVLGAVDLLPPGIASLYDYDNLDALLEKAPLYNNPPVESDEFVTIDRVLQAWDELKAA